jgi:hypothetical protein
MTFANFTHFETLPASAAPSRRPSHPVGAREKKYRHFQQFFAPFALFRGYLIR